MTATLPDVAAKRKQSELSAEQQAAIELVRQAKEQSLSLTGPVDSQADRPIRRALGKHRLKQDQ